MRIINRLPVNMMFGVLQSGLTSGLSTFIASLSHFGETRFWLNWLTSWMVAWVIMLPVVILAAPWLHRLAHWLVSDAATRK